MNTRMVCIWTMVLLIATSCLGMSAQLPQPTKHVVPLDFPLAEDSSGGVITADINNDGAMELLATAPGHIGAYTTAGARLWHLNVDVRVGGQAESQGLPGHEGPGLQVADIDSDGRAEVVFLTQDNTLHVLDGATANEKWAVTIPSPSGAQRWEHAVICCLRGEGDTDIILQATNQKGYRMGHYLAAFSLADLHVGKLTSLWQTDSFHACAHNGIRVADLDGDGRDEILSAHILGPDGEVLFHFPVKGHIDSVFVDDVRPDLPGLEVVVLEEGGGNRIFCAGKGGLIFETDYEHQEPQNAALGRFDLTRDGLQVWCRSRYNEHQKPFVFDARGALISHYAMDNVAPEGWTASGVEVIHTIDWTGDARQLACARERHTRGDVCIFDPISGEFILRIDESAGRLLVADVLGDWREEIIVWNGSELHVYENPAPNPAPDHARLWDSQHYRRSRMTYNYYSP